MDSLDASPLVVFVAVAVSVIALAIRPLPVIIEGGGITIGSLRCGRKRPADTLPVSHVTASTATTRGFAFTVTFATPPVMGVLALVLAGKLDVADVWRGGVVGDEYIMPVAIITLFMSLAYICVSVDQTGVLAWVAIKVVRLAGTSGRRLFAYIFLLSGFMTVVASNDTVILTLTPVIFYSTVATGCDSLPFLYAEFFTANIMSVLLMIGNPTNIIVAEANDFTFLQYSKWMALPTLAGGIVAFACLYAMFRHQIPLTIQQPNIDAGATLVDRNGAVFNSVVLAATVVGIALAPVLRVPIAGVCVCGAATVLVRALVQLPWHVVVKEEAAADELFPPASSAAPCVGTALTGLACAHNGVAALPLVPVDLATATTLGSTPDGLGAMPHVMTVLQAPSVADGANIAAPGPETETAVLHSEVAYMGVRKLSVGAAAAEVHHVMEEAADTIADVATTCCSTGSQRCTGGADTDVVDATSEHGDSVISVDAEISCGSRSPKSAERQPSLATVEASEDATCTTKQVTGSLVQLQPTVRGALLALPWAVVPFVFGQFVLVHALQQYGWLGAFAQTIARLLAPDASVSGPPPSALQGLLSVCAMLLITIVVSNVINNQPATILLTRIALSKAYVMPARQYMGSTLGVVLGSNVGANFTLVGALAGLMFAGILRDKGLHLSYASFAWNGLRVMVPVCGAALLVLWAELQSELW